MTELKRKENWPVLLSDFLADRSKIPFEWGKNDCMAFACAAVHRLTGVDYFPEFSDYHDEESAAALLERSGGVGGIIRACLGSGNRNILKAKRGDVVIVKIPGKTAGIVDDSGQRIAVVTKDGLTRIPLSKAYRFWSY